jgi:DNA repair protein RadD
LDVGIYSAGLKSRDLDHSVICCGIQSVFRRAEEFGRRDIVIVDEVHLVPSDGEGMYQTFLTELRRFNQHLRKIGLTATAFRTGEGKLTGADKLFQKVCYDVPVKRLIDEGFLCSVTNQAGAATLDTSSLHVRGGEFIGHEVESLFTAGDNVQAACREIVAKTADRHSVLVFCSGVKHAERVTTELESLTGQSVGLITGDTLPMIRSETLRRFRNREIKWLVNIDVLTTGFDATVIDCVVVLRATMSPGLFAQIVGRGFRVDPTKADCVVLDFGENLRRHGPIDSPDFGQESQSKGTGEGPQKTCPNCQEQLPAGMAECGCGFVFPDRKREPKHDGKADQDSALLSEVQEPQTWIVESVDWSRHRKKKATPDDPDTLRVDYSCQLADHIVAGNLTRETISEWVCLEHTGFARTKACLWWKARSMAAPPDTIDEAIELWERGAVASPERITTKREKRWYRIVSAEIDEKPDEWHDEPVTDDVFAVAGCDVPF